MHVHIQTIHNIIEFTLGCSLMMGCYIEPRITTTTVCMYLYKCLCKYTFTYFCIYDGWMLMMMVCGDICHATILRMLIHKMHTYIYKHMDDDDDGMRGHFAKQLY